MDRHNACQTNAMQTMRMRCMRPCMRYACHQSACDHALIFAFVDHEQMVLILSAARCLSVPAIAVVAMATAMAAACQAFEVGATVSLRASAGRATPTAARCGGMMMRPAGVGLRVPSSLGGTRIGRSHQRGFVRSYLAISGSSISSSIRCGSSTAICGSNSNANTGGARPTSNDDGGNKDPTTPTWTYVPYQPPPPPGRQKQQRRRFSSNGDWKVPNKITIPEDKLDISFVRSSGAGGQNVNKVNTKVELRFLLDDARWIPAEVRSRIKQNEAGRINKEGYLTVTSQEYRTQAQNRKDAVRKLEAMVLKAYPRPKLRKMRKGVSKAAKERKKQDKKQRSQTKTNRKAVDF